MTRPGVPPAESIDCRHCDAKAGEPCRTPRGRPCEAHLPRRRAYQRRLRAAGGPILGDSPIGRIAQAEADARRELDQ